MSMYFYKIPYNNQPVNVTVGFSNNSHQTTSRRALITQNEKLITENGELQIKLAAAEKAAMTDALTDVPNRASFELYLKTLNSQTNPDADAIGYAVIFVDGDNFKDVNDTHGHPVGDQIIIMIAENLKDVLPKGAVFARIGGEEYAVVLPNCSKEMATDFAECIRICMEDSTYKDGNKNVSITLSLGVAHSKQTTTVLKLADKALYFAKGQNIDYTDTNRDDTRNCVAYFDEVAGKFRVLPRTTIKELSIEERIRAELAEIRTASIMFRAQQEGKTLTPQEELRFNNVVRRARQEDTQPRREEIQPQTRRLRLVAAR